MTDQSSKGGLRALLKSYDWIEALPSNKKQGEAFVLRDWSFTDHFAALAQQYDLNKWREGGEPPDFELIGAGRVAVEVSRIVSPRKAIIDRSGMSGGYISTLRRARPTREFHRQVATRTLADNSLVRPHVEDIADLEKDYYSLAQERLEEKTRSATQIAPNYDRTLILLNDELSQFQDLNRRVPQLREMCASFDIPSNIEVVVIYRGGGSNIATVPLSDR